MRDCKMKDYKVKTKVIVMFETDTYLDGTDEFDVKAKVEYLIRSAIKFGFSKEINLKALINSSSYFEIDLKSDSYEIKNNV